MSELYGDTLINPTKGLNRIVKAGKKEGYSFDKDELGTALDEMDQAIRKAQQATGLFIGGDTEKDLYLTPF
ncbi:hypothetical protein [Synechococcus sp. MIT S1220]|uniref:hypothetical protein n=1 Tax=Synechococcus sp. MIT S1220 TaxID=3082549 RepID=UPI0039AFB799